MILWTKQNDIIRSTLDIKQPYNESGQTGLCSVLRPLQHSIGYMGDGFYRSKDPTNSIKVLKEATKENNTKSGQTRQPPDVQDLEGKKHEESVLLQCLSCEEHSRYKTVRP